MASSLNSLLDAYSEFTRGKHFIVDIKPSGHQMKKSKSSKVSREEKEFASYIGYQDDVNDAGYEDNDSCSIVGDRTLPPPHAADNFETNSRLENMRPNNFGMGRGKFFVQPPIQSLVPLSNVQSVRRNMQEVNDRIIGAQLREMGIGCSNGEIESEFHKKFRSNSSPVENVVTDTSDQEEPRKKSKLNTQPLYIPPALRSKSTRDSCNRDDDKTDVQVTFPVPSTSTVDTVQDTQHECDDEVAVESGDSESTKRDIHNDMSDNSITFHKKTNEHKLIQFKIKNNDVCQSSVKPNAGRNVLISGLLKRMAVEEKLPPVNEEIVKQDIKLNSSSIDIDTSDTTKGLFYRSTNRVDVTDNDFGNNEFDALKGYSDLKSSSTKHLIKSENSLSSQTGSQSSSRCSSSNNDRVDLDQPVYFTAPVSKKILPVTVSKTFIEIMSNNIRKPTNSTLGDFLKVSDGKLSPSSALSVELGSTLNPNACEFSPKSTHSGNYSSSDGDTFQLDSDEFPPL